MVKLTYRNSKSRQTKVIFIHEPTVHRAINIAKERHRLDERWYLVDARMKEDNINA